MSTLLPGRQHHDKALFSGRVGAAQTRGAAPPSAHEQEANVPDDVAIVARVLDGEAALFELLMRRHNQRLFRAARAIVKSDDEAEDVMQEAYVNAYTHLSQFAGRAKFSTWLTRIAVHEALSRMRGALAHA